MITADQAQAVRKMLESARLNSHEIEALLAKATDPDYWRSLNPELTVCSAASGDSGETHSLSGDEVARLADRFAVEGYFHAGAILSESRIETMRACVELLRAEKWPPVFTFVFDEFWNVVRGPSLRRLLTAFLGPGYCQNSVVWTYYVAPRPGVAGWPPHSDGYGEHRLTVWIPLTDATVENGCMYVIPQHLMPESLPADNADWNNLKRVEVTRLLQGTRALPAKAGSMIGWNHDAIHWGSTSQGSPTPRISIAVEFNGAEAGPVDWELPMLDGRSLPTFPDRLYTIGKRLLAYKKFEPRMVRYIEFAERLMAEGIAQGAKPRAVPGKSIEQKATGPTRI